MAALRARHDVAAVAARQAISDDLVREWGELAEQVSASPFLRPGWTLAWWAAFGRGRLEVLTAREDGRLAGLMPLARRGPNAGSPANWHTPEFGVLSCSDAAAHQVMASLFVSRPRHAYLSFIDATGITLDAFVEQASDAGYRVLRRALERSPYVSMTAGWQTYERTLRAQFRSEVRRRRRRLEEQGPVTLDIVDGRSGLDRALEEGFRLEASGWKDGSRTAIASQADTRQFYRDVARWAADQGWLRLAFLRCGPRALAFDFAMEHGGIHYLLKTGYDPAYHTFAPAMLLRHEMIARSFVLGLKSYEFLGRDEAWKLEWTRAFRERIQVRAFSTSLLGRVTDMTFRHGRPLARRVVENVKASSRS